MALENLHLFDVALRQQQIEHRRGHVVGCRWVPDGKLETLVPVGIEVLLGQREEGNGGVDDFDGW